MENVLGIAVIMYIAGVIGCTAAGEQRTIGAGKALLFAVFASPVVAALIVLAYPTREEIAYYHWLKKREDISQK